MNKEGKREVFAVNRPSWGSAGLVFLVWACGCSGPEPVAVPLGLRPMTVNGHEILVEIAATPERRETGLMHRDGLGKDRGMVFSFPAPSLQSFYMKNCRFPIDIAFIDEHGKIVTLHTMAVEAQDQNVYNYRRYPSKVPVPYALEMTGGWFAEKGVKVGDTVQNLPPLARY